ncbi:hypothetical protein GGX14DRAFT_566558 [Mycena pura]|uniref:Uncharacterized protein n=1 Tax=Mycena pura TaxID=153505 RepID=A0AAD6VCD4_9AGAR|nr:hypothetical protein GGX14DRAFT_566558 [Mycena pura]
MFFNKVLLVAGLIVPAALAVPAASDAATNALTGSATTPDEAIANATNVLASLQKWNDVARKVVRNAEPGAPAVGKFEKQMHLINSHILPQGESGDVGTLLGGLPAGIGGGALRGLLGGHTANVLGELCIGGLLSALDPNSVLDGSLVGPLVDLVDGLLLGLLGALDCLVAQLLLLLDGLLGSGSCGCTAQDLVALMDAQNNLIAELNTLGAACTGCTYCGSAAVLSKINDEITGLNLM